MRAVLLAVIVGACAGNGQPMGLPRELVVNRNEWLDVKAAPIRWRRIGDEPVVGWYRILISDRGDYCIVDAHDYVMAMDGDLWACRWRPAR